MAISLGRELLHLNIGRTKILDFQLPQNQCFRHWTATVPLTRFNYKLIFMHCLSASVPGKSIWLPNWTLGQCGHIVEWKSKHLLVVVGLKSTRGRVNHVSAWYANKLVDVNVSTIKCFEYHWCMFFSACPVHVWYKDNMTPVKSNNATKVIPKITDKTSNNFPHHFPLRMLKQEPSYSPFCKSNDKK